MIHIEMDSISCVAAQHDRNHRLYDDLQCYPTVHRGLAAAVLPGLDVFTVRGHGRHLRRPPHHVHKTVRRQTRGSYVRLHHSRRGKLNFRLMLSIILIVYSIH